MRREWNGSYITRYSMVWFQSKYAWNSHTANRVLLSVATVKHPARLRIRFKIVRSCPFNSKYSLGYLFKKACKRSEKRISSTIFVGSLVLRIIILTIYFISINLFRTYETERFFFIHSGKQIEQLVCSISSYSMLIECSVWTKATANARHTLHTGEKDITKNV